MITSTPNPASAGQWLTYKDRYPGLRADSDLDWEVTMPTCVLVPADLVNCTITPDGIYVENTAGDWDIIPFSELSQLLQGAGCRNLDERIDLVDPRLSMIAQLGNTVVRMPGQPGYVPTGQQRIIAALATADRSL